MNSVFKRYVDDNKKIIEDCFDIDWPLTKLDRFIKSEGDEVKWYIKSIYGYLREMYKHFAGVNPLGRVMGFSMATLSEVMNKCGNLVDGADIKTTDVDLCFISCIGGKKVSNWLSPEKGLVRYQISEAFVRLSCDKFMKTGFTTSYLIAVQKCFEEYVLPMCK